MADHDTDAVVSWAMVNIFVYRHPRPRSNRSDNTDNFHFGDLEITP